MGMTAEDLLKLKFPNLRFNYFQITSPATIQYNCIAWAAGKSDKWWWPVGYYWPGQVSRDASPKAFADAFAISGYSPCENDALEAGFEKVAIYVSDDGIVTHMARQLSDGRWTSKLGQGFDISHTLEGLTGDEYGHVAKILRRKLSPKKS